MRYDIRQCQTISDDTISEMCFPRGGIGISQKVPPKRQDRNLDKRSPQKGASQKAGSESFKRRRPKGRIGIWIRAALKKALPKRVGIYQKAPPKRQDRNLDKSSPQKGASQKAGSESLKRRKGQDRNLEKSGPQKGASQTA